MYHFLLDDPAFPHLLGTRTDGTAQPTDKTRRRLAAAVHAEDALRRAAAEGEPSPREVLR